MTTTTSAATYGQVTGQYAGPVTRLIAFFADAALVVAAYGLIVGLVAFALRSVLGVRIDTDDPEGFGWALAYGIWVFLYLVVSLTITGRTVGKWLTGLRVVERDGSPLRPRSAVVRVVALPLSFTIFGIGLVGIVVGRERRALHDVIASSVVVYDWGDRPATISAPLSRFLARREAIDRTP